MGVLACNRYGCENIMCDLYTDDFGYICHECYAEVTALKDATPSHNRVSAYDFVAGFMASEKKPASSGDFDQDFDDLIKGRHSR